MLAAETKPNAAIEALLGQALTNMTRYPGGSEAYQDAYIRAMALTDRIGGAVTLTKPDGTKISYQKSGATLIRTETSQTVVRSTDTPKQKKGLGGLFRGDM